MTTTDADADAEDFWYGLLTALVFGVLLWGLTTVTVAAVTP